MAYLRAKEVDVIEHLPILEPEEEFNLRSPSDVAKRIICLVFVTDFAQKNANDSYWEYIEKHSLKSWFTPDEWSFINNKKPDNQLVINMSWRIEGAYLLFWALGKIENIPFPTESIDPADVYSCLPQFDQSPHDFVSSVQLIKKSKIIDVADLIYRMHWATRQAYLEQSEMPSGLENGVVQEWHQAINWLAYIDDESWDDVSTDT